VLSAGAIILIWSAFRSENTKPTRSELVTLFFSGLMLWAEGMGFLSWAVQRIDSLYSILSTCTNIESGTNNGGTS
jgi:drug/metabolite transporter (DMT)-like permease